MTEEQIIQLAKKHLEVLISDDEDGEHPTDFAATYNQIIEFAREIFEKGQQEEIRRQKTGIGYVNGMLVVDEF